MNDQRFNEVEFVLNYPTDVSHMVGEIKGPNTLNEFFIATRVMYAGALDRSRVLFDLYSILDQ